MVVSAHAVIAVLFGARLRLKVLVAAKHGLLALAQMAERHTEDECKLELGELCIELCQLLIGQFFLILDHLL